MRLQNSDAAHVECVGHAGWRRLAGLRQRLFPTFGNEIGEVRRSVFELYQVGSQPFQAHLVHDNPLSEQGKQRNVDAEPVYPGEFVGAGLLRQGRAGNVGADLRKKREPDVPLDRQRAARFLFHHLHDPRFISIRVEGREDDYHDGHDDDEQASHDEQRVFQVFLAHDGLLVNVGKKTAAYLAALVLSHGNNLTGEETDQIVQ